MAGSWNAFSRLTAVASFLFPGIKRRRRRYRSTGLVLSHGDHIMSLLSTRGRVARFARFLSFGAMALAFAAGAAGPKAYVGNFKDSTVSVIDTASGAVVATIPVAAGPHGMAVSGDGRVVWVTGDGSSSMS